MKWKIFVYKHSKEKFVAINSNALFYLLQQRMCISFEIRHCLYKHKIFLAYRESNDNNNSTEKTAQSSMYCYETTKLPKPICFGLKCNCSEIKAIAQNSHKTTNK